MHYSSFTDKKWQRVKYNTSVEKEETTYTRNGYREVSVSFYIGKKERMRIKNYRDIRERVWIC